MKKLSYVFLALLITGFMTSPALAENKQKENKKNIQLNVAASTSIQLPPGILHAPGIEKRLENGKGLPPGMEKKNENKNKEDNTDTRAPKLLSVMIVDRTETSARVLWLTTERTDSKVWVSTSSSVDTSSAATVSSAELSFLHSLSVTNLTPNTTYYYVVASTDASGNISKSEVKSFTTKSSTSTTTTTPDIIAPQISSVRTSNISATGVRVQWNTNEDTTAKVLISTTTPVIEAGSAVFTAGSFMQNQTITVTSLTANTKYYFVVKATDRAGNVTTSSVQSFTTLAADMTQPTIFGPLVIQVTKDSARVIWLTNERADSKVWVSASSSVSTSGTATVSLDDDTFFHSVLVTGLNANTTYHYVVGSTDSSSNMRLSAESSFTTDVQ